MKLSDLSGKKIGICVSGGLDSKTVSKRLMDEGLDIVCFTADLAQPDEEDINNIPKKMAPCGVKTVIVDLKDEMAQGCFDVIKANAQYDGGYWNTTGLARAITVKGLVTAMKREGCNVLSHGATGRGNDQMRFERYTAVIDPDMDIFAPWRDETLLKQFPGRTEMANYLTQFNIPAVIGMKKKYSTDANLAGLSHEAEDLESLETPCTIVNPTMGVWPKDAPDKIETITLRFEKGYCVAIDERKMPSLAVMSEANNRAGRNGIGLKNALENRIIGTKSRGVYEAPGMELLGYGLQQIYQAILDRRSLALYKLMSQFISDQIYDGRYFDPSTVAARAAIDCLAEKATGTITIEMYKGNLHFNKLSDCPASIYNEADSSMEVSKEASNGFNPVSAQGYADILKVEALALAKAGQIRK